MNSVLLHDPDQANAGHYAVGLTSVYQTLHDRLLEALQKWVPPEDASGESVVNMSSPQSQHSPGNLENPNGKSRTVPFPTTNTTERCLMAPGGLQIDLSNLQFLLARSVQSPIVSQSSQLSSGLTIVTGSPASVVDTSKVDEQQCDSSRVSHNTVDTRVHPQAHFYSPLRVCTTGPQYQMSESLAAHLLTGDKQSKQFKNGLTLPSHKDSVDAGEQQFKSISTSSNLLHQLLSGADVTQVRNRSGLLEPTLCTKRVTETKQSQHTSPKEPHAENVSGTGGNHIPVPFTTATIPISNIQLVHSSPMDTANAMISTGTNPETYFLQQSLSGFASTLAPSIPNGSTSLVEKLLCLLIEIQKAQQSSASFNSIPMNSSVSPRPNASPCSTVVDGLPIGTPNSLNSPVPGFSAPFTNSSSSSSSGSGSGSRSGSNSSTPTPAATIPIHQDVTGSAQCLRQLLTTATVSHSDPDHLSPAKHQALKHNSRPQSPLRVGKSKLPREMWPLLHSEPVREDNNNNNNNNNEKGDNVNAYEPRPRSKSDIPNSMKRHLRLARDFRSRSQTKPENLTSRSSGPQFMESESESTCELESSLFAQLILSPDSPTRSSSRQSETVNKEFSHNPGHNESRTSGTGAGGGGGGDQYSQTPTTDSTHSTTSSRDSIRSPSRPTPMSVTPIATTKLTMDDPPNSPSPFLTCHSGSRTQVFEWLRESDLFVAEHCFDIPLGALLATAISPGRGQWAELCCSALFTPNPPVVDPVPGLAKHVVNKLWHQLLLVALIENGFRPQCVTSRTGNSSAQSDLNDLSKSGRNRSDLHHAQPLRDKVLHAISSLAALDMEESPAPDEHLVAELDRLVTDGSRMKLTPGLFRLIRYCILAQNAYPHHFSTTYSEALSELEAELTSTPGAPALTDVLKLLNHLHCFDAGTLKQFFGLSSDPIGAVSALRSSPTFTSAAELSPTAEMNSGSQNFGTFKRKADGIDDLISSNADTNEQGSSPIPVRSRAYTTTGCNKSARISTLASGNESESALMASASGVVFQGRPRSDTVPRTTRHNRRAERSWRFGIR
ncbi:unnamed protein product [Echinostoma caproni]|uniref:Uncharacterized protein n=1 Tax=Echinostoma caproni TaxID=27848 RepID=A0A183AFT1_9TREM|nr:unnamed protein product [Echinostoma caproni]